MPRALLIAEPYQSFAAQLVALAHEAEWKASVCHTFELAREALEAHPPDLLLTNLRLGLFNGIQLCYLIKRLNPHTPVIIYATEKDLGCGVDAQQACGLFERQSFLPHSLSAYLSAIDQTGQTSPATGLPDRDRRNPLVVDRRLYFRGGRRATDLAVLHHDRLPPPDAAQPDHR